MRLIVKQYNTANEALAMIASDLVIHGDQVHINNAVGESVVTSELLDYKIVFTPYYDNVITLSDRKFPLKGAMAEFLWYMTATPFVEPVTKYLANWANYATDGLVNSNYGVYWHRDIPWIIDELSKDKHTRRAVLNIYNANDKQKFGKDTPCTLYIQFFIRRNQLDMHVAMRSNDLWYGFSIDQFCNNMLHQLVYNSLLETYPDLNMGTYTHISNSMHVYDALVPKAKLVKLVNNYELERFKRHIIIIPDHITFMNFWETIGETKGSIFPKAMLQHFYDFKLSSILQ